MTAATLPTMTSGLASSRRISSAAVARSMARTRGLMASYRPLVLMSVIDAGQPEGLAGPGEHAGALGYQVFDAGTRGGGVVEDLDGETVCRQRGGRPLQALRGRRVGEQCCRNRGGHGASWAGRDVVRLTQSDNDNPAECEAARRLTFRRAVLSNWVRADATEGGAGTMTTRSGPAPLISGRPDPGLDAIMSERRQLINLTYRLLGSLAEAEDAVQETYARWYAMSRQQQDAIESPGAWLTTVASRICLNLLGSARARRETYVGEWIPEPLPERTEWISRAGRAAPPPTRPTGSPSTSRSTWPSSSCSNR